MNPCRLISCLHASMKLKTNQLYNTSCVQRTVNKSAKLAERMYKATLILPITCLIQAVCCVAQTQDPSTAHHVPTQIAIGVPSSTDENVVAIPPATCWTGAIAFGSAKPDTSRASDVLSWVNKQNASNGLESLNAPWRILISYEQFDEVSDKIHSGTYEELWAGPKKYRISYKADDLNQTDYATPQGLYRQGDQKWPNRASRSSKGSSQSLLLRNNVARCSRPRCI